MKTVPSLNLVYTEEAGYVTADVAEEKKLVRALVVVVVVAVNCYCCFSSCLLLEEFLIELSCVWCSPDGSFFAQTRRLGWARVHTHTHRRTFRCCDDIFSSGNLMSFMYSTSTNQLLILCSCVSTFDPPTKPKR